jgi:hypothetical protein
MRKICPYKRKKYNHSMATTITDIPFKTKSTLTFEEFMQLIEEKEDQAFGRMIEEGRKNDLVSHEEVMKVLFT